MLATFGWLLLVLASFVIGWLSSASAQTSPVPTNAAQPALVKATSDTDKVLRLNFRGVPLEQVLDYFGEAAGFIITPKVEIGGRVTVWSADPLTRDEAVTVLNSALARNGLGAIRSGRTLSIVGLDEARRRNTPVRRGDNPDDIPPTEDLVTQIIPVKFISAQQLLANLDSLLPSASGLSANEGANALVLTDTQASVRRVAEIVRALDTPIAAFSAVKVFALKFADAKALASVLKDLFAADTSRSGSGGNQVQQTFTGGPGGGGPRGPGGFGPNPFGGDGNAGASSRGSTGRVVTPRVVAAVDEQSNSLIVTAPEEQMPLIEDVVKQVDVPVEDVTELRVFKLKNAQPEDLASTLKSLFPDPSSGGNQGSRSGPQFGGPLIGGPGGFLAGGNAAAEGGASGGSSERRLKQGRVNTVADLRTGSLLVSAAPALMEQIAGIVAQLDADPARKQKVFVIPVENSDPAQIQSILQGLFPALNGSSSSSRQNAGVNGTTTRSTTSGGTQNQNGRNSSQGTGGGGSGSTGGLSFGGGSSGTGGR